MPKNVFKVFIVLYNDYSTCYGTGDLFLAAGQTVEQAIANAKEADPGISSLPIAYTEKEGFIMCTDGLKYLQVLEKTYVS